MTRIRAASIHLGLSAAIALILLGSFIFIWYPSPLFSAVGGDDVFFILLGVDITLGPLLTLVVFDQKKKSLRFDLSIIATAQFAALAYGVFTLLSGRPVYIAGLGHRFDLVQANEVNLGSLRQSGKHLPWSGPIIVGTKAPEDKHEREVIMFGGDDLGQRPSHHTDIVFMSAELLSRAKSVAELKKLNPGEEGLIDRWLAKRGVTADEVIYQGLKARAKDMAVIMDAKTAKVIGIAPFKPWP
jgi:hypothetical protein